MMRQHTRGFSLLVVLVFLLILGALALFATRMALMQEKMAGNSRDKTLSFLSAEAGLRDAEVFLATADSLPNSTNPTLNRNAAGQPPGVSRAPSMVIECVNACAVTADRVYYRIVVTGYGARESAQTRLETIMWVEE
ncbi:pilus assembly PilX family protein [Craterilacuibacter sinensis]|uniref:Type 4 fimbrial biogenesis protein PilX N-terminal domain-containing protein n=1 Tax=Craterilacuibacter sinensis TaxID=2686017 RepID=A0A845BMV2_9NEIS|nr:PilX N-terminal domain-containing pilus assembly protein [Craterilacuibacter sinensis]MXR37712.1 hypothetical protein [Craterilacuibacter sinensis]